jgi:polysaccharide deacetylase family protein (PEP-CTERM system associated)
MRASSDATGPIVNAMSIDVEDYFHVSVFDGIVPRSRWDNMESRVVANTERLLDIFAEHEVRSTFFVLGWVAERQPGLVKQLAERGHEVASHGYAHRLVYDQTPRAFREDVRRAKLLLEDASGRKVSGYRAPSYSITPRSLWALDILIEEGYEYDSSIFPIRHDRYGIPVSARLPYRIDRNAGSLIEIPGSTTQLGPVNLPVAGGATFESCPTAGLAGASTVSIASNSALRCFTCTRGKSIRSSHAWRLVGWEHFAITAISGIPNAACGSSSPISASARWSRWSRRRG